MTSYESRQQTVVLAVALIAACGLVVLVTGTLLGAYGARLGGMRTLAIVGISLLTSGVVRAIWLRRNVPASPVPSGPGATAAAVKGIVVVLLGYLALMAAMGAFLGYFAPALGVPRPILTGLTTVMVSLIFLPQVVKRMDVWKRLRS